MYCELLQQSNALIKQASDAAGYNLGALEKKLSRDSQRSHLLAAAIPAAAAKARKNVQVGMLGAGALGGVAGAGLGAGVGNMLSDDDDTEDEKSTNRWRGAAIGGAVGAGGSALASYLLGPAYEKAMIKKVVAKINSDLQ